MKVAVCVSGLMEGNVEKNISRMKSVLPYDFFFSTWDTLGNTSSLPDVKIYKEPEALESHEVFHHRKEIHIKMLHRHKQILAHAYTLRDLDKSYDMIVRARYDVIINPRIKWNILLEDSYNQNVPIGISNTADFQRYALPKKITYGIDKEDTKIKLGGGLNDQLIFHRRDLFNVNRVFDLYKEKKLKIAEHGWWQILVEENFAPKNHLDDPCINVCGAVLIEKYLTQDVIDTL